MNKNYSEKFEKMSVAGKLAAQTLDMITEYIKPGISTNKIDQLCYEFIKDNKGYSAPLFYRGFKKSLCTSLNHVVCHGIPSDRVLEEGDTVNVDVTAIVENHYGEKPIIYSTRGFYYEYIQNNFKDYPIWVASYTSKNRIRNINWTFHQFSDKFISKFINIIS